LHQPCKSNTGKYRSDLPLSFAAKTALKASNQPKSRNKPRALSTTSVSKLRISFAAGAAQLADSTRAMKVKSRVQHLIRNRFYDPRSGRFMSEDLIRAFEQSLYSYVMNAPTELIDPFGSKPCPCNSECPSGSWSFKQLVSEEPALTAIQSKESFVFEATCYGIDVPVEPAKTKVSIKCKATGVLAEGGWSGLGTTGGFSNACSSGDIPGNYRGGTAGLRFATEFVLKKEGGDQWMNFGYGSIGLGIRVAYATCKVELAQGTTK